MTARRGERLRILFLNWRDIRNPDAGGAEIFIHEVAKRWVEDGHEVSLLTSGFGGGATAETIDGVRVRRVGRLRKGSFHLLAQRELRRLRGFDLVVDAINTIPFLTPVWRRRLPPTIALVFQLAGDVWDFEVPRPIAGIGRWIEPRLLQAYRDFPVATISDSGRNDLRELGIENVVVIRPGRDDPPDLDGVEKEPVPTFLFAGRLAANKRPDHAVAAFELISAVRPDARLWIAGRGPMERELAKALPDGAELLGYVPRGELYERMARAHVLLVPSVREGWGLVVIEANSVGTPAVGYDVHGIRDSIRDGETGLLAATGYPASLARHALSLVSDSETYDAVRKRAIEWAEGFSWESTAAELLAFAERGRAEAAPSPPVSGVTARAPY